MERVQDNYKGSIAYELMLAWQEINDVVTEKLPGLGRNIGVTGTITARNAEQSYTLTHSIPTKNKRSSHRSPSGCALGLMVKEIRSALNLSQMRSRPYPIPASWLGNKVPFTKQRANTFFPLK